MIIELMRSIHVDIVFILLTDSLWCFTAPLDTCESRDTYNLKNRKDSLNVSRKGGNCSSSKMHGINHLLSHHGSHNGDTRPTAAAAQPHQEQKCSSASDTRQQNTKILQELLSQKHIQKRISRGSVSSTYSYGSSTSYGSSHGSSSSNHSSSLYHGAHNHSVYHTIHGNSHYMHQTNHHHHHPLQHIHQMHQTNSGRASPTSPSPTGDQEKHHHQHHHHYSIQEMIRHFGRRLGHIRRQSECQDPPRKKEEDFRNRSQSLDGGARHPSLRDADCETTYRIYESILRQGNRRTNVSSSFFGCFGCFDRTISYFSKIFFPFE